MRRLEEAVKLKEKISLIKFLSMELTFQKKLKILAKKGVEGFVLGTSSLFWWARNLISKLFLELRVIDGGEI